MIYEFLRRYLPKTLSHRTVNCTKLSDVENPAPGGPTLGVSFLIVFLVCYAF